MADGYELIGSEGCGSMVVEMAFALADRPVTLTDLPYLNPGPGRDRLMTLNPLGQVPTLVLPDGTVMTESAAMILHLADGTPQAVLLPAVGDPRRPAAVNLLVLLVAAVYPTFTFADSPEKWVGEGEAAATLKQRVDGRRLEIFRQLEARFAGEEAFLFGAAPTAADLYLAAMVFWRPGRAWFRAETPTLSAIAERVARLPAVAPIMARHKMG